MGGRGRAGEQEAGEKSRGWKRKAGVDMTWRAKSKPANHEAESAYVTSEGGASGNVRKISEICYGREGSERESVGESGMAW